MTLTGPVTELLNTFRYLAERSETVYEDSLDTRVTNYVAFIGFTVLVWDHLITLEDEIRYIWRGRKSILVYLFFFNRYFTPISFIGNFIAYFSDWSAKEYICLTGFVTITLLMVASPRCNEFVRYEGATVSIAVWVSCLMMFMRVKALYADRPKIIYCVGLVLLVEAGVFGWLLAHGEAVQHTVAVHECSMIFDPGLGFAPSLSAWIPMAYDTIVILLTLYRCAGLVKQKTASRVVRTLLKDGLVYYSVIFCVNLVLAVMIVSAPSGIKNIAAQLEQLLTVAMMSRITLSLRRKAMLDTGADVTDTYLFPPSIEEQSFHVYVPSGKEEDKGLEQWIENASTGAVISGFSPGASCASDGRNAVGHSYSPTTNSRIFVESPSMNSPRSSIFSSHFRPGDAPIHDPSSLEFGIPSQPERAVLTDRDVFELCALRPSKYLRT